MGAAVRRRPLSVPRASQLSSEVLWRPLSVPRAVSCPLRCSPGSRRLSLSLPVMRRGRAARRKAPGPVHLEAGAGSPHTTHTDCPATGLRHRTTVLWAALPCPGHSRDCPSVSREGVGGLQVASRCPVVPDARQVHFFQIKRHGFNTQTERVAGTAADSDVTGCRWP